MATYSVVCSAVGGFGYANRFTLYVELANRNGDPSTNQSIVDYNVYFQNTSGGGTFTAKTRLYFRLNGVVIRDETISVTGPRNGSVAIASGSMTVGHNSDGSQAVTFQALVQGSTYGISGNIENTFWLDTIPRYSEINSFSIQSIGVNTVTLQYSVSRTANIYCSVDGQNWGNPQVYNTTSGTFTIGGLSPGVNHSFAILVRAVDSGLDRISGNLFATTLDIARIQSANNFNIGETPSMTYSSTPSGCTLKAYLERITGQGGSRIDSISATKEVGGTSCTFDYDTNWLYSQLSSSNSAWCRYCLVTVCNGTEYLHYVDRQYFVANSNPIFSNFEYRDVNEDIVNNLTGNDQTIIKGFSNVEAIISVANKATAINGASMKEYRLSIGEKSEKASYSDTEDVAMTINSVLSNKFTIYAVDSRENSTPKEIMASNYIEYQNIAIKTITATRKNNVLPETTLNFDGVIWDGNFGLVDNEITECYYRFRNVTQQEWTDGTTEIVPIKNGINFSFSAVVVGDLGAEGFDIDESFEIQVFVKDKLSDNYSNPASFILGPGTPAVAIYKNKVAIGGRYDTNLGGALQISGKIFQNGQPIEAGSSGDTLPIGSVVEWVSDIYPENWLKCNGQAVSRAEYPELFSVLGTTYGAGDGSTTFNVPDLRARVPVGASAGDPNFNKIGMYGGYTTQGLRALIGATHADSTRIGYRTEDKVPGFGYTYVIQGSLVASSITADSVNHSTTVLQKDGSDPTTIQPYTVVHFIIKAKQSAGLVANIVDNLKSTSTTDALSANQGRLLNGIIIYDNVSGTTGAVELYESSANFKFLDILFVINDGGQRMTSKKIARIPVDPNANNNVFDNYVGSSYTYLYNKYFNINAKSLYVHKNRMVTQGANERTQEDNANYIYITKVIGYY